MFTVGQRQVSAIIFVVLMIGATLIGKTPDNLLEVITQLAAPIAAVGGIFFYLLKALQTRIADPADPLEPGKIVHGLLGSAEFITAVVMSVLSLLPMVGINLGEEQRQLIVTLVINAVSLLIGVPLMRSYALRGSGQPVQDQPNVEVTVQTTA